MDAMADQDVTRKILAKIDSEPAISQKRMAEEIGISVGMINWHIKRCASKGLIKFQQAPVRRYLYYLTPEGFAEKAKLTASYLQSSFNIFKTGRVQYEALFVECSKNGWSDIAFLGDTELTELASMVAARFDDLNVVSIIDENATRKEHYGIPLAVSRQQRRKLAKTKKIDAIIACNYFASIDELINKDAIFGELKLDKSRFLIPEFLR